MRLRPALLAFMLSAVPLIGAGQTSASPAAEQPAPRYEIELIVFSHRNFDPAEENFTPPASPWETALPQAPREPLMHTPPVLMELEDPAMADPAAGEAGLQPTGDAPALGGSELAGPAGGAGAYGQPRPQPGAQPPAGPAVPGQPFSAEQQQGLGAPGMAGQRPFGFRLLEPGELRLRDVYAALQRAGAYQLIAHGGWVQEGLPLDEARPFDLSRLGILNPTGSIRLHLSRFLHLSVDLRYQADRPRTAWSGAGLSEFALGPRYQIHAERRARSGELHYFDHPAFGVLVVIRPRPVEAPDSTAVSPAA